MGKAASRAATVRESVSQVSCRSERLPAILLLLLLVCVHSLHAAAKVEYAGGTVAMLAEGSNGSADVSDEKYFAIYTGKQQLRIPYDHINLLEYGQKVNRRVLLAMAISPAFLLAKSRKHFLTVGFQDDNGKQQAMVFRVDKNGIRSTLVSLEARTGVKIQYQDEEARKAGRG